MVTIYFDETRREKTITKVDYDLIINFEDLVERRRDKKIGTVTRIAREEKCHLLRKHRKSHPALPGSNNLRA